MSHCENSPRASLSEADLVIWVLKIKAGFNISLRYFQPRLPTCSLSWDECTTKQRLKWKNSKIHQMFIIRGLHNHLSPPPKKYLFTDNAMKICFLVVASIPEISIMCLNEQRISKAGSCWRGFLQLVGWIGKSPSWISQLCCWKTLSRQILHTKHSKKKQNWLWKETSSCQNCWSNTSFD